MKIVCISDTHTVSLKQKLPKGDMIIHAGDFCNTGSVDDVMDFNEWFSRLPYRYKICVAGNHDILFEENIILAGGLLASNIIYLQDTGVIIEGIKFWGSPWQHPFCNWAFNRPGNILKEKFEQIPNDTNVLITHAPPFGILDKLPGYDHIGEKELRDVVFKVRPKYHIFGHIHSAAGIDKISLRGTTFINASLLDEDYTEEYNAAVFKI